MICSYTTMLKSSRAQTTGQLSPPGNRAQDSEGAKALTIPPQQNQILAAFLPDDYEAVTASARVLSLKQGQRLYRQNAPIDSVYFPLNSVVSVIVGAKNREQIDMASIGNEGMVGASAALDISRA